MQAHYYGQAYGGLEHTWINFKELSSPKARYALYQLASKMLTDMGQYPMTEPERPEF